ncbi:MAG: flagellar hook-basal body complex protein FliE [Pseudomonadota bacterium]|nr:flagellar hook-basal body complex protein FliE [Pseudomonadota bacterium]
MTDITTVTVTPRSAAAAYGAVERGGSAIGPGEDFGATLERAVGGAIAEGHAADTQAAAAITGSGSITDVTTALARAQLALESATAIRDRVVQAYQDIMKMPI